MMSDRGTRPIRATLFLAAWMSAATLALAQSPPAPLATLVPSDAGLTVELVDLSRATREFTGGELYHRLSEYAPWQQWLSAHGPALSAPVKKLGELLGAPPGVIWNNLLGREALVAAWPPAPGETYGPGLLVVRAPDAALLGRVVGRLIDLNKQGGTWKETTERDVAGQKFTVHVVKVAGDRPLSLTYLVVAGDLGIITNSHQVLDGILTRAAGHDAQLPSLASSDTYREAIGRLSPRAAVRAWLNPRPWDEVMHVRQAADDTSGSASLPARMVARAWKATRYVAVGLDVGPNVSLEVAWAFDRSALPEPWRQIAESASGPTRLLERIPHTAVAACAGRLDASQIVRALFLPEKRDQPEARPFAWPLKPDWGWLLPVTVAGGLGPDLGAFLVPAPRSASGQSPAWPVDWVAHLQTQPLEPNEPALGELLAPLVTRALRLAVHAENARRRSGASSPDAAPARIETETIDGLRLTSIWGVRPFSPRHPLIYTVKDGRVLVGTSSSAVRQAATLGKDESLVKLTEWPRWLGTKQREPGWLAFIDLEAMRPLLVDWPQGIDLLMTEHKLDRPTAETRWREITGLFRLADKLVVAGRVDEDGASLQVRLEAKGGR